MKRLFTLIITALVAVTGVWAQRADFRKVAEQLNSVNTLTASITQTRHNAALTSGDAVSKGTFYFQKPNTQSIILDNKEMLLAKDGTFTMVRDGRQRVQQAKGRGNNPFEVLQDVFQNLLSADDNAALTTMADVKLDKQGTTGTMTITPQTGKGKGRMMYTSCVATFDLKTNHMTSLRIKERGGNYTQYDFTGYKPNAEVSSSVFDTSAVLK